MERDQLLPRKLLFGGSNRADVKLSRDGRYIAWVETRDSILRLQVRDLVEGSTNSIFELDRPVLSLDWTYDGRIIIIDDIEGDENSRIWLVNCQNGARSLLSAEQHVLSEIIAMSPDIPNQIVMIQNDRDPFWHDVWRVDIETGERLKIFENTGGYSGFIFDRQLILRMLVHEDREAGGLRICTYADGEISLLSVVPHEDEDQNYIYGFERDGVHYLSRSSVDRDCSALYRINSITGHRSVLAEHERADLSSIVRNPVNGEVIAARFEYMHPAWTVICAEFIADFDVLRASFGADSDFYIQSQSSDAKLWIVFSDNAIRPGHYYIYDRTRRSLVLLFAETDLPGDFPYLNTTAIEITSRDGLKLVSYLTLPRGNSKYQSRQALPMVLLVHGGPWVRDAYGFNREHQWIADRGYVALSVNYRGSSGFGKSFLNAGDREHGGRIIDDLLDATQWAIKNGISDKNRIAIMGESYGGFAVLAALAFAPEVFCCGVSIAGFSNLVTFLENAPPYWKSAEVMTFRRYNDPNSADGRSWLWSHSPIAHVDQMTAPLLIAHGKNDVRCTFREAEQIVAELRKRGRNVVFIGFPKEGHNKWKVESEIVFRAFVEGFLADFLYGDYEPLNEEMNIDVFTEL